MTAQVQESIRPIDLASSRNLSREHDGTGDGRAIASGRTPTPKRATQQSLDIGRKQNVFAVKAIKIEGLFEGVVEFVEVYADLGVLAGTHLGSCRPRHRSGKRIAGIALPNTPGSSSTVQSPSRSVKTFAGATDGGGQRNSDRLIRLSRELGLATKAIKALGADVPIPDEGVEDFTSRDSRGRRPGRHFSIRGHRRAQA